MKKAKSPQIAGFFVLLLFLFTGGEAAGFTIYSKRSGRIYPRKATTFTFL